MCAARRQFGAGSRWDGCGGAKERLARDFLSESGLPGRAPPNRPDSVPNRARDGTTVARAGRSRGRLPTGAAGPGLHAAPRLGKIPGTRRGGAGASPPPAPWRSCGSLGQTWAGGPAGCRMTVFMMCERFQWLLVPVSSLDLCVGPALAGRRADPGIGPAVPLGRLGPATTGRTTVTVQRCRPNDDYVIVVVVVAAMSPSSSSSSSS